MFRQLDFRSFFNFLGRNKLYTAINIFGLSLSLMFVILIADYTVRQLTVDSFHSKAGRIYVVSNENTVASAYFLQKHLLDRYPEIEATCAVSFEDHHTVEADGKLALADVLYADTTFFRIFDFELAAGDRSRGAFARRRGEELHRQRRDARYRAFGHPAGRPALPRRSADEEEQ